MAIVKMKKVSLIALNSDQENILNDLAWLTKIDISSPYDDNDQSLNSKNIMIDETKEKIESIQKAMDLLSPFSNKKRKLFSPRYKLSRNDCNVIKEKEDSLIKKANDIISLNNDIQRSESEINRLENSKKYLEPIEEYNLPLSYSGTKTTDISLGYVPKETNIDDILNQDVFSDGFYYETISEKDERRYVCTFTLKEYADQYKDLFEKIRFTPVQIESYDKTSIEELKDIDDKIQHFKNDIEKYRSEISSSVDVLPEMEKLSDIETNDLEIQKAKLNLCQSDACFELNGYIPEKEEERFEKIISGYNCYSDISDPTEEDDVPILLQNNKFVAPYESITEMYALPVYGGIDPNASMAPFYLVLFGMMFGDAGYGFLMSLVCGLVILFADPKPRMKRTMMLFFMCGLSTIVWGLLFGTVFGNSITVIAQTYLGLDYSFQPIWFDPINNPIQMLILSIAIGYIQILVSLIMKAVTAFHKGDWKAAVFDAGFWFITLVGIAMLIIGMMMFEIFKVPGIVVTIIGVVGLLLTQGRDKKNIFGKITGGLLSLYDSTGYLSDLLSYSRILALGLSSSVIGQVFNTIGSLMGPGILSMFFFIIVFIIGHALNFALSFLSAYVHASRLQFIEFFGRFYESGGRPFSPLSVDGKYSDMIHDN